MKNSILKINEQDNVLVALQDLAKETIIQYEGKAIMLQEDIPAKHKFYVTDMQEGSEVIMYGVLVGKVQQNLMAGTRMSTQNLKHASEAFGYRDVNFKWQAPDVSKFAHQTFNGYHRADGTVGTANYWLFIPTVFCENRNMDVIREALHNGLGYAVSDKYTQYTHQLLKAFQQGDDINSIHLKDIEKYNVKIIDYKIVSYQTI